MEGQPKRGRPSLETQLARASLRASGWMEEASQLERAHASRAHTVRAVLQEAQEPEDSRSTAYKDLFADPVDVKLIMSGAPPSRPLDLLRTHELLLIVVASAGPRFAKLQSLLTRFLRKPSAALFRAFAESGVAFIGARV